MRHVQVVLVAVVAIPLAGCVLAGKPKTVAAAPSPPQPTAPAPPPEPLSIPQTNVELPAPQTLNPEALNTTPPAESTPQAQSKPSEVPKPPLPRAPNANPARPPDTQPAQTEQPASEPARTPIGEILTPDEQKDYKEKAHKYQADTRAVLAAAKPRTSNQQRQKQDINNFLKQSEDADNTGDLRLALRLAELAYTLAKELQSGK
jgi:hypothetical protein